MPVEIRNLGRHPEDYWIAEVSADGERWFPVDRKYGSWRVPSAVAGRYADVLHVVAAELQKETIKAERKERSRVLTPELDLGEHNRP